MSKEEPNVILNKALIYHKDLSLANCESCQNSMCWTLSLPSHNLWLLRMRSHVIFGEGFEPVRHDGIHGYRLPGATLSERHRDR